jgi:hypothetical protein
MEDTRMTKHENEYYMYKYEGITVPIAILNKTFEKVVQRAEAKYRLFKLVPDDLTFEGYEMNWNEQKEKYEFSEQAPAGTYFINKLINIMERK